MLLRSGHESGSSNIGEVCLLLPVVVVMSTGVLTRSENFSFRHDKLSGVALT